MLAPSTTTLECTGGAINAIDTSPDESLVILGGRDVLRIVRIHPDGSLTEGKNLRGGAKKGLQLSANDVKWHPTCASTIAMGSTSGAVLLFDATKPSSAGNTKLGEHSRTVNRLAWHPSHRSWLLSGGQDGKVRMWDARIPSGGGVATFGAAYAYPAETRRVLGGVFPPSAGFEYAYRGMDSVRDLQFDPFRPTQFAAALEDGSVQLWDVRRRELPLLRFPAHTGLVMCLQWHPTQPYTLATGGRDRIVKVWRLPMGGEGDAAAPGSAEPNGGVGSCEAGSGGGSGGAWEDHRWVPAATIQTQASVGRLCWRPVLPQSAAGGVSAGGEEEAGGTLDTERRLLEGRDRRQNRGNTLLFDGPATDEDYQIATVAALLDNHIYGWDVRRPHVPVAQFAGHRDVPTGLIWIPAPQGQQPPSAPGGDALLDGGPAALSLEERSVVRRPWLLTSGKDGRLLLHDPVSAARPLRSMRTTSIALSASSIAWVHQPLRDGFWDAPGTGGMEGGAQPSASPAAPNLRPNTSLFPSHRRGGGIAAPRFAVLKTEEKLFSSVQHMQEAAAANRGGAGDDTPVWAGRLAGLLAAFSPPSHVFAALALSYVTEGGDVQTLCNHNAAIAAQVGMVLLGQMWQTLAAMWGPAPPARPGAKRQLYISAQLPAPPAAGSGERGKAVVDPPLPPRSDQASRARVAADGDTTLLHPRKEEGSNAVAPLLAPRPGEPAAAPSQQKGVDEVGLGAAASISPHPTAPMDSSSFPQEAVTATIGAAAPGGFTPLPTADAQPHGASSPAPAVSATGVAGNMVQQRIVLRAPDPHAPIIPGLIPGLLEAMLPASSPHPSSAPGSSVGEPHSSATTLEYGFTSLLDEEALTVYSSGGDDAAASEDAEDADGAASPAARLDSLLLLSSSTTTRHAATGAAGGGGLATSSNNAMISNSAAGRSPHDGVSRPHEGASHSSSSRSLSAPGGALALPAAAAPPPPSTLLDLDEFEEASWAKFRMEATVELLEFYADRGDVQTCVTVARTLGVAVEEAVGQRRLQQWLLQYIDLLHRLELWAPASTVMARCNDVKLRTLNKTKTSFSAACARCDAPIEMQAHSRAPGEQGVEQSELGGRHAASSATTPTLAGTSAATPLGAPLTCANCSSHVSSCAVCLLPVRGVFAWCQGCGHGGHLDHLQSWFRESSLCPSGCMHACVLG